MDRRRFLHSLAGAAAVAALPSCRTSAGAGLGRRHLPNVLLIMSDDLGYGDLGVTGRTDYRTPVLDQLAREGVQLTQAYSAAPVCTPTRVALLTGRFPARTRAGLYEPLTTNPDGLDADPPTLGWLMKDAGYETALVGKWHLGTLPQFHPLRHGWDEFYGFLGAAADYTSHLDTEFLQSLFQDGTAPVRTDGYLTDLFTDRAMRIVSRDRSRPLFLNLQYNAPHWPWQAPGDPPYPDSLRWSRGGSPGPCQGQCGALYCRLRKKGRARRRETMRTARSVKRSVRYPGVRTVRVPSWKRFSRDSVSTWLA